MEDTTIPGYTITGALVRRAYSQGGETIPAGTRLSVDEFEAINASVRRLWVRDGNLLPIYTPDESVPRPLGTRHVIHRGAGRYDVVQGVQINTDPLSREEAEALAGADAQAAA